ncbi:MAG: LPS export ABC transporter permease LptF [Gammaproteobacteria bacterium]|nr:MAG: LPS export ABC transporter permease LptF [Gammaproteobacteria bacterium]
MSSVIRRYLSLELLQYWLIITLVLWLVLVAARFSLYLGQAASGQLPAATVLWLLALKSVGFFVFLLPLTLFLALLWLLGRLNRDRESLALGASGVGTVQLYRAVALPVLGATLLVAVLTWYLVPRTAAQGYQLRNQAEHNLDMDALAPGRFHSLQKGRWLVYARRSGRQAGTLEDVFVHVSGSDHAQVLVARSAGVEVSDDSDERFLVLHDGYRYDGIPGQADYRVLRYKEYALHLQAATTSRDKKWDAIPMQALWTTPGPQASAELHKRLSRPVTVLVLALIAIPLARFRPTVSPIYPLWLGVLIFTLYFNLLGTGQLWIEQGRIPGWLGLWWVHGLLLVPLLAWAWTRHGWPRRVMA